MGARTKRLDRARLAMYPLRSRVRDYEADDAPRTSLHMAFVLECCQSMRKHTRHTATKPPPNDRSWRRIPPAFPASKPLSSDQRWGWGVRTRGGAVDLPHALDPLLQDLGVHGARRLQEARGGWGGGGWQGQGGSPFRPPLLLAAWPWLLQRWFCSWTVNLLHLILLLGDEGACTPTQHPRGSGSLIPPLPSSRLVRLFYSFKYKKNTIFFL